MEYTKEGCPLRRSEGVAVSPRKFWEGRVAENRAFRVPFRWGGRGGGAVGGGGRESPADRWPGCCQNAEEGKE